MKFSIAKLMLKYVFKKHQRVYCKEIVPARCPVLEGSIWCVIVSGDFTPVIISQLLGEGFEADDYYCVEFFSKGICAFTHAFTDIPKDCQFTQSQIDSCKQLWRRRCQSHHHRLFPIDRCGRLPHVLHAAVHCLPISLSTRNIV